MHCYPFYFNSIYTNQSFAILMRVHSIDFINIALRITALVFF